MKKQPEITEQTRQAFMEAFCLLYSQKPLEKITVQEVTRRAGYNRSTFYQYFSDINELLSCVEQEFLDYLSKTRWKLAAESQSFIVDLVELYETKALYINALFGEFTSSHFLERLKEAVRFDVPELEGISDSELTPYLMEYRLSGAISLFRLWLRRGKDLSAPDFLALIAKLYQQGSLSGSAAKTD